MNFHFATKQYKLLLGATFLLSLCITSFADSSSSSSSSSLRNDTQISSVDFNDNEEEEFEYVSGRDLSEIEAGIFDDPSDSDDYDDFGEIEIDDDEDDDFDIEEYYKQNLREQYIHDHNITTNETISPPHEGLDPEILEHIESKTGVGSVDQLKHLILQFVTHAEENDEEPPAIEDVLETVSTDMGLEAWVLEWYLDHHYPTEAQDILDSYTVAVQTARANKIQAFVNIFSKKMIEELRLGMPMEKILEQLNMDEHYLDEALEAYNHPEVIEALREAELDGAEKATQVANTYVESVSTGTRRLMGSSPAQNQQHRRTQQQETMAQQEAEIMEYYRKRKLRRASLLRSTKEFVVRVHDHKNFVHHHGRRLTGCDNSMTNEECNAHKLTEMADNLVTLSANVELAINPVIEFFNMFDEAEDKLSLLKTIMMTLKLALTVAAKLDGVLFGGTPVFGLLKGVVDTIKPKTDQAANYAEDFEDDFIKQWNGTITKITNMMDTFSSTTETAAGVGVFFAEVTDSQCARNIVDGIAPGLIGSTETAIDSFVDGAESIVNVMEDLVDAIGGSAWKDAKSGLTFIANLINDIFSVLNPMKPIAKALTTPIPFPWVSIKSKPYLGPASCTNSNDRAYQQLGATCWEKDSSNWKLAGPLLMQKKCSTENLRSSGVANTCQLPGQNMRRHSGTKSIRVCAKIKIKGTRIKKKKCWRDRVKYFYYSCPSGTTWFVNKCYPNRCPGSFIKGLPNICIPKPVRAQHVKPAGCSKYQGPNWMDPVGLCWKKCERGFTDVGIMCVKTGDFDFSIQDIFDQLDKIISQIEGTQYYKMVNDGIATVLENALKIFESLIKEIVGPFDLSFQVPRLSIGSNMLPFDEVNLNVPSGPSVDLDFAGGVMDKISAAIPFDGLATCGADVECMMDKMGVPGLEEIITKLQNMFSVDDISAIRDAMMEIIPSVKCKSWDETTLELGDAFKAITGRSCDQCNKQVPICKEMGTEFLEDEIQGIINNQVKPILESGMNTIQEEFEALRRARELAGIPITERELEQTYSTAKKWQVILPIPIYTTFAVDESVTNQRSGKWESYFMADHGHEGGTKGGEYLNGIFIALIPTFRLELGLNYINWKDLFPLPQNNFQSNPIDDLGIKFGMDFELKVSSTGEVNSLLERRRQWVQKMRSLDESDIYKKGDALCFVESIANQKLMRSDDPQSIAYKIDTSLSDEALKIKKHNWGKVCQPLEDAIKYVWEENQKDDCEPDDMLSWHDPYDDAERRKGIRCVKYWWDTKRLVEKRIAEFERLKEEAIKNIAVSYPSALWMTLKNGVKHGLNPKHWPFDSSLVVNQLVTLAGGYVRDGLRPRMWFRRQISPVDYFEWGPMLQFDINNGDMNFFGFGVGSITYHSLQEYRKEKALLKQQKIKKEDGRLVDRPIGSTEVLAIGASVWCQVSFFPGKGQVRDVFFCPGILTI